MNWTRRLAGLLALICTGLVAATPAEAQFGTGQGPAAQLPGGRAGETKQEPRRRLDPSQDATRPIQGPPPPAAKKKAADDDDDEAPKGKAAKKKVDPAAIGKAIDAAAKQIASGKAEPAIKALSGILAAGDLPSGLMARALYLRGAAHRKQGRAGPAIADLTGALWLKNGLTAADRADAALQRSAAYRDAGLPVPAEVTPQQRAATPGKSGAVPEPVSRKDKPSVSSWQTGSTDKQRTGTPAPPPAAEDPSSKGGGLGGFFGNLFGGGEPAKPPAEPAVPPKTAVPAWDTEVTPQKGKRDRSSSVDPGVCCYL